MQASEERVLHAILMPSTHACMPGVMHATRSAPAVRRCEDLSNNAYKDDVLILAGDISDDQAVLRSTFQLAVQKFGHVFFVPGNHDLWVRRKERDVLDSLGAHTFLGTALTLICALHTLRYMYNTC